MKKINFILVFSLLVIIIFSCACTVSALEITDYPPIPGLNPPNPKCTGDTCLGEFVSYWVGLLIYLGGAVAVISFAIGAVTLIMSLDNPEAEKNAKDRMRGSILGLVLVLASITILRTINIKLVDVSLTTLPGVEGVYYTKGDERKTALKEASDISRDIPAGFNTLMYACSDVQDLSNPVYDLLVWKYPKVNFEGNGDKFEGVTLERLKCGQSKPIGNSGSYRMELETDGVYLCLDGCSDTNCKGFMSGAFTGDLDDVGPLWRGNIKGIRIVNPTIPNATPQNSVVYGVILHTNIGLDKGGECAPPEGEYSPGGKCIPVNIPISSMNVFILNKDPASSGEGVTFYSKPHGWNAGTEAGFLKVTPKEMKPLYQNFASKMCFSYEGVNVLGVDKYRCKESSCNNRDKSCKDNKVCKAGEICQNEICVDEKTKDPGCSPGACETFGDPKCAGSIKIDTSYLVALYSRLTANTSDNKWYCKTWRNDVPNLSATPFRGDGGGPIEYAYVIPVK